jgi:hypothetical protein
VHTLVPHLELGMTGFDESGAAVRLVPLLDLLFVFDGDYVFNLEALCARECQAFVIDLCINNAI